MGERERLKHRKTIVTVPGRYELGDVDRNRDQGQTALSREERTYKLIRTHKLRTYRRGAVKSLPLLSDTDRLTKPTVPLRASRSAAGGEKHASAPEAKFTVAGTSIAPPPPPPPPSISPPLPPVPKLSPPPLRVSPPPKRQILGSAAAAAWQP